MLDNPHCLGYWLSPSLLDELISKLSRLGEGYINVGGAIYHCQFAVNHNRIKGIPPEIYYKSFPRILNSVNSDRFEHKKKTKRGRR